MILYTKSCSKQFFGNYKACTVTTIATLFEKYADH